MGKRRGNFSDGLKFVYHAYQLSQTAGSLRGKGAQVLLAVKESVLFVLVLAAAVGLLWVATLAIRYVVHLVN
jgi:hypothetical protein